MFYFLFTFSVVSNVFLIFVVVIVITTVAFVVVVIAALCACVVIVVANIMLLLGLLCEPYLTVSFNDVCFNFNIYIWPFCLMVELIFPFCLINVMR